ncbi:MAG: hypothetical protein HKN27_13190, partial [Silicimonas sp.]|nr:hypothetical protein [Silicimonas sp.]
PQAQSATAKRDRALSETIRQIQDDLSDDESAPSTEAEFESAPAETESDDVLGTDIIEVETTEIAVEMSSSVESSDTDDSDDELAMSQLLENVSERTEHVEDADPVPSKPLNDENTDADVGRLLEETDSKLNEDGVVRRRQVISQMRAAVAATKADRAVTRLISVEDQDEVEKKAYRNDLSDAVSETKPLPEHTSDRKPSGPPLVLVSSQRVSEEAGEDDSGVDAPVEPVISNESFARFVENNGAKGIEELLEAAAAYTVFNKGQESFSRPEIMKRVAMVDPALSMSREDGLRSFGQLLRQGKFQKLERGQFTIDRDTRFNPEKRIAGE